MHWVIRLFRSVRSHRYVSLFAIFALLAVGIVGNAVCYYLFDGPDQPEMQFSDALWYSVISITTIGYGDYSAQSAGARIGTVVFVVLIGLASFTMFLGIVVDWTTELFFRGKTGMNSIVAKDHILLINYPSADRINQMIAEIRAEPRNRRQEIVLVTDKITEFVSPDENVLFVQGNPLDQETYQRAQLKQAVMAILLATSYSDTSSDAVVASAVAVIESIHPEIYTVAECLNPAHKMLFNSVRCDALVLSLQISGNLLIREAQDPGISRLAEEITSSAKGCTLFSTEVTTDTCKQTYSELAKQLLDREVNLICINRGNCSITSFFHLRPQPEDRIVYTAATRLEWPQMQAGNSSTSPATKTKRWQK